MCCTLNSDKPKIYFLVEAVLIVIDGTYIYVVSDFKGMYIASPLAVAPSDPSGGFAHKELK